MFDFLTGIVDIFTGLFQAIQDLFNFIGGLLSWIYNIAAGVFGSISYIINLIPAHVRIIIGPLFGLTICCCILRYVAWIKHMIPFN